jgi:hypothetical protein
VETLRERRRQQQLARSRAPIDCSEFERRLDLAGIEPHFAQFVWERMQPYYFKPLTPYPEDRPVTGLRIDGDDLSEMVTDFEKQFSRVWCGKWIGPDDPTLTEFARALIDSTKTA